MQPGPRPLCPATILFSLGRLSIEDAYDLHWIKSIEEINRVLKAFEKTNGLRSLTILVNLLSPRR
ncbi:MAG: hypothetical protein Udaeo2_30470 [Candidatus Udaeobacter sp.]|nr:MAG: hypothetical protein Udaeo2_30470 [Candidatus Udaeobacter sp.]